MGRPNTMVVRNDEGTEIFRKLFSFWLVSTKKFKGLFSFYIVSTSTENTSISYRTQIQKWQFRLVLMLSKGK